MLPHPPSLQDALPIVPASQLGLEGRSLNGLAFSQFDGRATWDYAGKSYVTTTSTGGSSRASSGSRGTSAAGTNSTGAGSSSGSTNSTGGGTSGGRTNS